jgi:hypothetical protein
VGFVGFVTFLFAVAMVRPSAAVGGGVFPEDMSAFTLRSFGAYFLALVLGALVVARRRTLGPLISHIEGGLAITVPILVAAVVHLEVFDVGAHPLQWLYLGAYVATVAIGLPTVLRYRRVAGPARVLAPSPPAGSPAPGAPAR